MGNVGVSKARRFMFEEQKQLASENICLGYKKIGCRPWKKSCSKRKVYSEQNIEVQKTSRPVKFNNADKLSMAKEHNIVSESELES